MQYKNSSSAFLPVAIAICLLVACTKDKTPQPATAHSTPCDPAKVYFQTSIQPLLNSNCAMSGCHDAATRQDGVDLSSYAGVRQELVPGRPENSDLIEVINATDPSERMPPSPRPALSAEQKDLLWKWIQQGADNATCDAGTAGCSPVNVSFAADIRPIINANCLGCHSGASPSGGIQLSSYGGVKPVASSGKLFNAVAQNGQATPMPPNAKLTPCDVQKIKVWVNEGANDN